AVEGETVADAAAPVMAGDRKHLVPEGLHDLNHVLRHRPLGIGEVVRIIGRAGTCSVPPKIRKYDSETAREGGRQLVPHDMRLRISVQEQERWTVAAKPQEYLRTEGRDAPFLEAGKQLAHFSGLPCSRSIARQPMSDRQYPCGHLIHRTAR